MITRVLGTDGEIQPDVVEKPVFAGDRVLLCSDGLTGMLADTEILELLAGGEGPQETAEMLVKAALAAGGEDNVTVVVIDVTPEATGTNRQANRRPRSRRRSCSDPATAAPS